MARVCIAGIVGGVVLFVWGAASHMVLQIGDAGMSQLKAKEGPVVAALRENITEPGLYAYPGFMSDHPSEAEQEEWMEKYRSGPAGLIIYMPKGGEAMTPTQLGTQLGVCVAIALLAAVLLARAAGWKTTFLSRVVFVSLLGLLPFLAVNVPFWNWYGFPGTFTMAQFVDHTIGFVLLGLILAAIIRSPSASV